VTLVLIFVSERKPDFMEQCDKKFQELFQGCYILPDYTHTSGKIKVLGVVLPDLPILTILEQKMPAITCYFNGSWSCNCTMKTKVGVYLGEHCWHEEWAMAHSTKQVQQEINEMEEQHRHRTRYGGCN